MIGAPKIFEIKEHKLLTKFYIDNGLEIADGWEKTSGVFLSEAMFFENQSEGVPDFGEVENGEILAAYSVSRRHNVFILDYIAICEECRKNRLGSLLMERLKEKLRLIGADKIYLTAKVKAFFKKNGARELSVEDPLYQKLLGECCGCDMRGESCFPTVMVIEDF